MPAQSRLSRMRNKAFSLICAALRVGRFWLGVSDILILSGCGHNFSANSRGSYLPTRESAGTEVSFVDVLAGC